MITQEIWSLLKAFPSSIPPLIAFVSETEKQKHRGACQAYYDGLKVPWWGSKEAAASDKSVAPSPIPFFRSASGPGTKSLPPPRPPTISTHQRPIGLALDWHAWSSLQRKRLNQQAPRGATGDDWHSQDNLPLKHYWVFSPLQRAFQLVFVLLFCPHISAITPFTLPSPTLPFSTFSLLSPRPQHTSASTLRQTNLKMQCKSDDVHLLSYLLRSLSTLKLQNNI